MTTAYPLAWPLGWPRTGARTTSRFRTGTSAAAKNVMEELRRFSSDTGRKVESVIISSNVSLMDEKPRDPGVACYFRWDGIDGCIAVDRYPTPAENLQAISLVIEAERTKLRHGGLHIVRAAFRGYAALPPPKDASGQLARPWRDVLGVTAAATLPDAEAAYRQAVKLHHPDRGGDPAVFNGYTDAIRQAREELGR
ncbi:hypothetical protein STAQ_28190 [Allostella sp. ATCC 35155]|nr:hypothetical protein STAQ_28190 [Stella sp. ATCC 35155]